MNLHWRRPLLYAVLYALLYALLPTLLFLAVVGFPPPFAPLRAMRPGQEQLQPAERKSGEQQREAGA